MFAQQRSRQQETNSLLLSRMHSGSRVRTAGSPTRLLACPARALPREKQGMLVRREGGEASTDTYPPPWLPPGSSPVSPLHFLPSLCGHGPVINNYPSTCYGMSTNGAVIRSEVLLLCVHCVHFLCFPVRSASTTCLNWNTTSSGTCSCTHMHHTHTSGTGASEMMTTETQRHE